MKIAVSVIETSADMHAASLMSEIKKINKDISFFGFGGEHMKAIGFDLRADLTHRSTIGILEPLRHILHYLGALSRFKKYLSQENPKALLCVDGEGFNLVVARAAKKLKIPVIYYISPQAWLWGTEKQGTKAAKVIDLVMAIFPEEARYYKKLGVQVIYNGHPLSDIVKPSITAASFKKLVGSSKPIISFFSGSRSQELKHFLPIFAQAASRLDNKYKPVFVAANQRAQKALAKYPFKVILAKDRYNAMNFSEMIVATTGTTTLEAGICGVPMITGYKFPELSYRVIMALYRKRLPKYMALPNMLLEKEVVPELLQHKLTAENILAEIENIDTKKMRTDLSKIKKKLARQDVLKNNAKQLVKFLETKTD